MTKTLGWTLCSVALLIAVIYCLVTPGLPIYNFWSVIGTFSYAVGTYLTFKKEEDF